MQTTNAFGSFLVAALSVSLAAGTVIPNVLPHHGNFEVKRVANDGFSGRNGPLALARAYRKYGIPVSDDLIQAVENMSKLHLKRDNGTGTATATPDNGDLEYLVPVNIGTPAQTLNLDFDTGSADLWVFSTETQSGGSGHTLYSPSKSSTSKKMAGATWSIQYADGSGSSGDVYTDSVTVGGLNVPGQAVESAEKVSSQFSQGDSDGLLGLAFSSINTVQPTAQKTFFDNLMSGLDKPLFTADLRHNTPGSYVFGAVPSAASDVLYAPVDNSQGFWMFSTSSPLGGTFNAIADTGTTLLLTSDAIVQAYYKQVQGATNSAQQGGYVFPCSATLPDFTFKVGSGTVTVPGSLINYATAGGSQCFGGLQSAQGNPFAIFGDIAMKAAYVVFDGGNTQVGWATKTTL